MLVAVDITTSHIVLTNESSSGADTFSLASETRLATKSTALSSTLGSGDELIAFSNKERIRTLVSRWPSALNLSWRAAKTSGSADMVKRYAGDGERNRDYSR